MKKVKKQNTNDRVFMVCVYIFVIICTFAALYPMVYTVSMSISGPEHVAVNDIFFLPKGFSTQAYIVVF